MVLLHAVLPLGPGAIAVDHALLMTVFGATLLVGGAGAFLLALRSGSPGPAPSGQDALLAGPPRQAGGPHEPAGPPRVRSTAVASMERRVRRWLDPSILTGVIRPAPGDPVARTRDAWQELDRDVGRPGHGRPWPVDALLPDGGAGAADASELIDPIVNPSAPARRPGHGPSER